MDTKAPCKANKFIYVSHLVRIKRQRAPIFLHMKHLVYRLEKCTTPFTEILLYGVNKRAGHVTLGVGIERNPHYT